MPYSQGFSGKDCSPRSCDSKRKVGLTNWIPVSLRIPIPAEAKFAPTSNFWPVRLGLRYGNVDSDPSCLPDQTYHMFHSLKPHTNTWKKNRASNLMSEFWSPTDEIGDVEPIGKPSSGLVSWVVNSVRRWVCSGSGRQVVVVPIINKRVSKHKEGSSWLCKLWAES